MARRSATLLDIANAAGVSTAVVSRLVNNDATLRVSAATRARVLEFVREMGYSPNVAARSLRSARSDLIALVVHDVTNLVYAEIVRGAQQAASDFGKALLLSDASGSPDKLVDIINGNGLDGIVLQPIGDSTDNVVVASLRAEVPIVLLQSRPHAGAHLISLPDALAARLASEHLLEAGHRRIGCVCTAPGLTFSRERERGWREGLAGSGIDAPDAWLVHAGPTVAEGAAAASELLARSPSLSAVVFCNAMAALGGLHAIGAMGIAVPESLSVVALHDITLCDYTRPRLTTVTLPLFELGQRAVSLVSGGPGGGRDRTLIDEPGPTVVVRDSVGPP